MTRSTISGAVAELYAAFAATPADRHSNPVAALDGIVTQVYDHEPPASSAQKPVALTICVEHLGPTDWTVVLRLYVTGDLPAHDQQDKITDATEAVDHLMPVGFGPSDWSIGWTPELDCWVASCPLLVGREDGF